MKIKAAALVALAWLRDGVSLASQIALGFVILSIIGGILGFISSLATIKLCNLWEWTSRKARESSAKKAVPAKTEAVPV